MNLFKKKTTTTVVVKEKTLAEELSSIQSVFRTALTKAQALSSKISAKKEATNGTSTISFKRNKFIININNCKTRI